MLRASKPATAFIKMHRLAKGKQPTDIIRPSKFLYIATRILLDVLDTKQWADKITL